MFSHMWYIGARWLSLITILELHLIPGSYAWLVSPPECPLTISLFLINLVQTSGMMDSSIFSINSSQKSPSGATYHEIHLVFWKTNKNPTKGEHGNLLEDI